MSAPLPFVLPTVPVDRYEVSWWSVDYDGTVRKIRAVYHVDTPYESLPWTAGYCGGGGGAPFVDQWEMFDGIEQTRPSGRVCGWTAITKSVDSRTFADHGSAVSESRRLLKSSILAAERRIAEARRKLRDLRARVSS